MAACSWGPQSQRSDPNTSPVRHSLCTRTSTLSCALGCAHDEGQVGLVVEDALVGEAGELAPLGGEAGLGRSGAPASPAGGGSG